MVRMDEKSKEGEPSIVPRRTWPSTWTWYSILVVLVPTARNRFYWMPLYMASIIPYTTE